MNSVEIIALILVIVALIKLVILLINPKSWMSFVKKLYSSPNLLLGIELILTAIVFYYLIQYLTIIEIMAGVCFGALLTGMAFATYGKELMPIFIRLFNKGGIFKKAWLPILVWLALCIFALKILFF